MISVGESEGLGGYSGGWRRVAKVPAAEGVGFEPTVRFHAHTLSKRAP
jgi:hypothetical protein